METVGKVKCVLNYRLGYSINYSYFCPACDNKNNYHLYVEKLEKVIYSKCKKCKAKLKIKLIYGG